MRRYSGAPLRGSWSGRVGHDVVVDTILSFLRSLGIWGVFAFSALDTVGLPASGDVSVLVAAASGDYPLPAIAALGFAGALLGDHAAYWFGRIGRRALERFIRVGDRERRLYVKLDRNAPLTLAGGRIVAAVRSEVAIAAGASRLPYARFTLWNAIGCATWAIGFTLLGWTLADFVDVDALASELHRYGTILLIAAITGYVLWRVYRRRAGA